MTSPDIAARAKEMLDGLAGVSSGPYHRHEWEGVLKQTDVRDSASRTIVQVPWDRGTDRSAHRDAEHFARCSPEDLRPILEAATRISTLEAEVARLRAAISWIEAPFVDENTPLGELQKRVALCVLDARRARSALSEGKG